MTFAEIKNIKDKILNGGLISGAQAKELSQTRNIEILLYSADQIRSRFRQRRFEMCASASLNTPMSKCCPCCMSSSDSEIIKKIDNEYLYLQTGELFKCGVNKIGLVSYSACLSDKEVDDICQICQQITINSGITICLSAGLITAEQFEKLKKAGIIHYNCNLEILSDTFFNEATEIRDKKIIDTIKSAQQTGLNICAACSIGQGESMADRISIALKFRDLKIKSIVFNINRNIGDNVTEIPNQEILSTIAVFRFIIPDANLRWLKRKDKLEIIEDEAYKAGISATVAGCVFNNHNIKEIEEEIKKLKSKGKLFG